MFNQVNGYIDKDGNIVVKIPKYYDHTWHFAEPPRKTKKETLKDIEDSYSNNIEFLDIKIL